MFLRIAAAIFMAVLIWIGISTLFGAIATASKIGEPWVWPIIGCLGVANAIAIAFAIFTVAKKT